MNGTGVKEVAVSTLMLFIVLISLRIFFIRSLSNSQHMMYIVSVICYILSAGYRYIFSAKGLED